MPHFRFIIKGSDFEMVTHGEDEEDGLVNGFFTTRRAKGADQEAAKAIVLQNLKQEWAEHAPTLTVLDAWKTAFIEMRRTPNAGHVFFSDDESRYAAASLEAEASRAPESTVIRKLASLHVEDDDE